MNQKIERHFTYALRDTAQLSAAADANHAQMSPPRTKAVHTVEPSLKTLSDVAAAYCIRTHRVRSSALCTPDGSPAGPSRLVLVSLTSSSLAATCTLFLALPQDVSCCFPAPPPVTAASPPRGRPPPPMLYSEDGSYRHSGCRGGGGGCADLARRTLFAIRVMYAGASCVVGLKVHSANSWLSCASRTHAVSCSLSFMC